MNKDWKYYFYEISKIPRKSGNEESIKNYLITFAEERNFEYYADELNNVIIWKEANGKQNNQEIIGLQAHVDMVCEKTINSNHDFSKDPIKIIEEDGIIRAKDTSLGADNGIGVAYLLAILDSTIIPHPKIEAIFTTQEETTMDGVRCLDANKIKSKKIISFDNFNEKELWIGSASSQEWYVEINGDVVEYKDIRTYRLSVLDFIGGHAGIDIGDEKRGNPIKVVFEIIKDTNVYINNIKAGSLINVIPRDCEIVFSIKEKDLEIINDIKDRITHMKNKYNKARFEITEIKKELRMLDLNASKKTIEVINEFRVGAINRDDNGNVVVGSNLATIQMSSNTVEISFSVRGNRRKLTDIYVDYIKNNIIQKHSLNIKKYDEWCGYEQDINSELVNVCKEIYIRETNEMPNVLGVQACLECEFLGQKVKGLQYVALGTNTYDVHSVNERIEIKSIQRTWNIFLEILKYYCERS